MMREPEAEQSGRSMLLKSESCRPPFCQATRFINTHRMRLEFNAEQLAREDGLAR